MHLGGHADVVLCFAVAHHIRYHCVNAVAVRRTEHAHRLPRQVCRDNQSGAHSVVDVVIDIGNAVGKMDNAPLRCLRMPRAGVAGNAVPHLMRQIQPVAIALQAIHHAQALLVVMKAADFAAQAVQRALADMPERRVPEVMPKRHRFGQIFIEPQAARNRPRNLRDLQRVRQPVAVMVSFRGNKDLCLVSQPPERLAVHNAVAVALKAGAARTRCNAVFSAAAFVRKGRPVGQRLPFQSFLILAHRPALPLLDLRKIPYINKYRTAFANSSFFRKFF